ncbi:hypothetical protein PSYRMG_03995 [Pseudomonas syringae UMAF0158]|nr:hypothetical protein PSYRMG_03995 [Pseudomonas syringae UMAF0158]
MQLLPLGQREMMVGPGYALIKMKDVFASRLPFGVVLFSEKVN